MSKIIFTSGTIQNLTFDYCTLILFNGDKEVYKGTIERLHAAQLIDKYDNRKIKFIK